MYILIFHSLIWAKKGVHYIQQNTVISKKTQMTPLFRMPSNRNLGMIQYGSHWPYVAIGHLKWGAGDVTVELNFLFYLSLVNLSLNSHM